MNCIKNNGIHHFVIRELRAQFLVHKIHSRLTDWVWNINAFLSELKYIATQWTESNWMEMDKMISIVNCLELFLGWNTCCYKHEHFTMRSFSLGMRSMFNGKWLEHIFMEKRQRDWKKGCFCAKPKKSKRCTTFSKNSNECCSYWKMHADNQLYMNIWTTEIECNKCELQWFRLFRHKIENIKLFSQQCSWPE